MQIDVVKMTRLIQQVKKLKVMFHKNPLITTHAATLTSFAVQQIIHSIPHIIDAELQQKHMRINEAVLRCALPLSA